MRRKRGKGGERGVGGFAGEGDLVADEGFAPIDV
jgi:hypothetical protein